MTQKQTVYIAGPLGFSEAGRTFYYNNFLPIIKKYGYNVLDPWQLAPLAKIEEIRALPYGSAKRIAWQALNMEIGANNEKLINSSDGVIAILDGPDIDSGTAAEIGFAFGKGKQIIGYRGDFRLSSENEGGLVNLQVEYFIRKSGGTIVTSLMELEGTLQTRPFKT